ncbi:hypothetical protein L2W95_26985, partial [Citrobacter freundii]|nr:hypothetical protein [Citrobacter freundii]
VHVQLHQQKGMISLSPPTICNSATATARKLAILFYNALKYGQKYVDPGADYYEERYRNRVLDGLKRRAKSLGYSLQQDPELCV